MPFQSPAFRSRPSLTLYCKSLEDFRDTLPHIDNRLLVNKQMQKLTLLDLTYEDHEILFLLKGENVDSCLHLFVRLFIHLFILSFVYSFIHPFLYSFIHLFVFSLIHSFIHSYIHQVNESKLLIIECLITFLSSTILLKYCLHSSSIMFTVCATLSVL